MQGEIFFICIHMSFLTSGWGPHSPYLISMSCRPSISPLLNFIKRFEILCRNLKIPYTIVTSWKAFFPFSSCSLGVWPNHPRKFPLLIWFYLFDLLFILSKLGFTSFPSFLFQATCDLEVGGGRIFVIYLKCFPPFKPNAQGTVYIPKISRNLEPNWRTLSN